MMAGTMQSLAFLLAVTSAFAASIPLAPRAVGPATNLPSGWTYTGCYVDNVVNRALKQAFPSVDFQSGAQCASHCASMGYDVAGTEWGCECFCDWELNAVKANESDCGTSCTGNVGEACGGPLRLNVYQAATNLPITNPGDGTTFKHVGCYPDVVQDRLLPAEPLAGPALTVGTCIDACRKAGFSSNATSTAYAGVEYSQECFCGRDTVLPAAAAGLVPHLTGCDMACKGNNSEVCGGSNRLNVYLIDPSALSTKPVSTTATRSAATTTSSSSSSSSAVPTTSYTTPVASTTSASSTTSIKPTSYSTTILTSATSTSPAKVTVSVTSTALPSTSSAVSSSSTAGASTSTTSNTSTTSTSKVASSTTSSLSTSATPTLSSSSSSTTAKTTTSTPSSSSSTVSSTSTSTQSSSSSSNSSTSRPTSTPSSTSTISYTSTSTTITTSTVIPVSTTTVISSTRSTTASTSSSRPTNAPSKVNVNAEQAASTTTTSSTSIPTTRQILVNPDFETTGTYAAWKVTPNSYYPSSTRIDYSLTNSTTFASNGVRAFQATAPSSPNPYTNSIYVSQEAYHSAPGRYSITASIGRIARVANPVSSVDTISWEIQVDGFKVKDGDVCNPHQRECTIAAVNEEIVYRLEGWEQTVKETGWHEWAICVVIWGMNPDTVLVDGVQVWGPF